MVLQRGIPVPVWGLADPGYDVTVTFGGQRKQATAGVDRKWMVRLAPMAASSMGQELVIEGSTTIAFTNVLVGDVWLASGQSNMALGVGAAANAAEEIAGADHPLIRHMGVEPLGSMVPEPNVVVRWSWEVCSTSSVPNLSAVAYSFARSIQETTHVPIGILESCWGGTSAELWTSPDALAAVPELNLMAQQQVEEYSRGDRTLQFTAGAAFNAMIHPLIPFALRGVIWYQGEGNVDRPMEYRVLFPTLIQDWRNRWQQRGFPIYYVQLPNYYDPGMPLIREAQELTLQNSTNTGMAVTIDIGELEVIHPPNKQDVGKRLAALALRRTYGLDVIAEGPRVRRFSVDGRLVKLEFDHTDGGLMVGQKTGVDPVMELPGLSPKWFEIAGADGVYHIADADIHGTSVLLFSPFVADPVAARYAWRPNPSDTILYNRAGFPAAPFRIEPSTRRMLTPTLAFENGVARLSGVVESNVTWWIEAEDRLDEPGWFPVTLPRTGTGSLEQVILFDQPAQQRYFRWRQEP